jgi:hypothetical protein
MTPRSTQLCAAHITSGSLGLVYTVPAGKRTIVKSLTCYNDHAGTNYLQVVGYTGATELFQVRVYMAAAGSTGDTQELMLWLVLNAGQTVEMAAEASGVQVLMSGAELDL